MLHPRQLASLMLVFGCLVLAGCLQASTEAAEPEARTLEAPLPEGSVRLATATRPFITVGPASDAPGALLLSAPARVVLQDAALARVGAPVSGRVVEVHVAVGEVVRAGAALVTLRSPDAAGARAALAASSAELHAVRVA